MIWLEHAADNSTQVDQTYVVMVRCALGIQEFFDLHIQPGLLPHLPPDPIFGVLAVLETTPGQAPRMRFTIGMFAKKDVSLIVKDQCSDRHTKPRPDQPCNEQLKSKRKLPPDIKQVLHEY